jgi:hypothetical protein
MSFFNQFYSFPMLGLLLALVTIPSFAAQQIVTNANEDTSAGSLRAAIIKAADGDTVAVNVPEFDFFPPGYFPIEIAKNIVINGLNSATKNRIVMAGNDKLFLITKGNVTIKGIILTGGGVESENGSNIVLDSVVIGNCATSAIINGATMTIINSTIDSNYLYSTNAGDSYCRGAGIYNYKEMAVINSTIYNNSTTAESSYPWNLDAGYVTKSYGGGIWNEGRMIMINCTLCKDSSCAIPAPMETDYAYAYGSGIYNSNQLTIVFCTICYNSSSDVRTLGGPSGAVPNGAGIYNDMTSSGTSCFILNSAIVFNSIFIVSTPNYQTAYDDFVSEGSNNYRAVNSFFGVGYPSNIKNCDTGAVARGISFKSKTPGENGGPTKTIVLNSNSNAIGAGIRAGTYIQDTIISGVRDSMLKAAYYDGQNWIGLENDSIIPPGTMVAEITTDQRGISRSAKPCVGATEYVSARISNAPAPNVKAFGKSIYIANNILFFNLLKQTTVNIDLFNLSGQKIFASRVNVPVGKFKIPLLSFSKCALLCRVTVNDKTSTQMLIK